MANDTSTGYASNWNVAPVTGREIVTFSPMTQPFLARTNGLRIASSDEIAMSAQYALESAAQPAITEAGSTTAPTAVAFDRSNEVNAVQIFQESVVVTYSRMSAVNRLKVAEVGTSGYGYTNDPNSNPVQSELDFQSAAALQNILLDYEYSALSGTYQKATAANVANKMRGIITACTSNTVAASSAALSKALIDELLLEMATSGAMFTRPVFYANAFQKQALTNIYSFVSTDRNVGGANIQLVETDFGIAEVVYSRNMPTDTLLIADMAQVWTVSQPVPGKAYLPNGLVFLEELSKTGAAEKYQMYGQLSIDYGSEKYHGTITGLATSA